jgi:FkbM family methyltransferase
MKTFLKSLPLIGPALRRVHHRWKGDPLWSALLLWSTLQGRKNLYVVQIGSNDGITDDPIHSLLESNPSWKALLVEPVPFLFERLRKNYSNNPNIRFANVAISEQAGMATFYYVDPVAKDHIPQLPLWFDQLGSFDRRHIACHLGALERFTVSTEIPTLPLSTLLDRNNVSKIDLLHIDTEGHDWKILRQLDLTRFHPDVILFEHKHLSEDDKTKALAFLERDYRIIKLEFDFLCQRRGVWVRMFTRSNNGSRSTVLNR